ncbi:flagellar motor protein MotB [Acidocella sp.]|uniref:flagellar motor protein MotB n=1 Tax=Acidocella sp. TaxID=50710 RepID=UPI002626973A|nr:flagellar motor protein MotB [Acidocella sp.]
MSGSGRKSKGRRQEPEKHANHERWVISYADLLTLLLATFVVLYASSTRSKHKEDEFAQAFIKAFHGTPPSVIITKPGASNGILEKINIPAPTDVRDKKKSNLSNNMRQQIEKEVQNLEALQLKLMSIFQPLIAQKSVAITSAPLSLTIQLDASVLFQSGQAALKPDAVALLRQVGDGLAQLPGQFKIVVQGYTDNQPISTAQFSSNWSLSAERAVTVVELFESVGVNGDALSAQGFGQFSPVADNSNAQGRAKNRRVVVVVRAAESSE